MSAALAGNSARIVVIGVGNTFGRDDGAGPTVIGALRHPAGPDDLVLLEGVELCDLDGEPTRLVEAWSGSSLAIVIDAIRSGADPGTVQRFELGVDELPASAGASSSHAIGVAHAIDLGSALDRLPGRLVVYGVEGADFGPGPGLSEPVARSIDRVAVAVRAEISAALVAVATVATAPSHSRVSEV